MCVCVCVYVCVKREENENGPTVLMSSVSFSLICSHCFSLPLSLPLSQICKLYLPLLALLMTKEQRGKRD